MAAMAGILVGLALAKVNYQVNADLIFISLLLFPVIFLRKRSAIILALSIGVIFGLWRGGQLQSDLKFYQLYQSRQVSVAGTVIDDTSYDESGQLEFQIENIELAGNKLPGRLRIRGFTGALVIRRGDKVSVEGKLYPGFGSRQGSISYGTIKLVQRNSSWTESLRRDFFSGVYTALPEPQASLGLGFLVGTRTLLPEVLIDALRRVGLTHIVAVSGYNLTILVRFARRFGMLFSKWLAAILAITLVSGFIAIAGNSPSIARAAVVTAMSVGAWYYGRRVSPVMLLLGSSAVTAMINPLFLWSDLGWWLSFLAFFGILIIAPLVKKRIFGERKLHWMAMILIETTSAQLMTLPLIMAAFGEFSVISLLANMIILPLVPLAMLLVFISGLAGMFIPAFAAWLAWPATVVMTFVTEVVSVLARPNWAFIKGVLLDWNTIGVIYIAVVIMCIATYRYLRVKQRPVFDYSVIE